MLRVQDLPKFVRKICFLENIWIVGSTALPETVEVGNDVDVLIPYSSWPLVARFIPEDAKVTSQGGWRFTQDGVSIDVWPGDLGEMASHEAFVAAWSPKSGKRITSVKKPSFDLVEYREQLKRTIPKDGY